MLILLDIPDNKSASSIKELLKNYASVKTTKLSLEDAATLKEIKHIKEAFKLAEKVKSGALKGRPARNLLHEL